MPTDLSFREFIRRVRAGDADAAANLVRRYETAVRMEVRLRMRDESLNSLFDSLDICQSVMRSFFVRAAAGQFDLKCPADLVELLVSMAQRKLAAQVRYQRRLCRDHRRNEPLSRRHEKALASHTTPEQQATGRDLLAQVRLQLTPEERLLADRRGEGWTWPEIADAVGGTPQALRKQLARALDRVTRLLGIDWSPSWPRPSRAVPTARPIPANDTQCLPPSN
jgi:RNA polymerase sigma-70 factor (ECF subfamily)